MSRLTRAIAIRPGEGRTVMLVGGAFALVDAGRGLGEVGADTLVLTRIGEEILPFLFIGLGIVGLVLTLTYSVALTRSSSRRFFPGLLVVLATVLGVEWLLALSGVEAVTPIVWVSVYAAGLLLLTVMWTVGGLTFDARQAKRLFPLLTSAAVVGSMAGFLFAIGLQRLLGAESLIAAEALLLGVAAALLFRLGPPTRPRHEIQEARPSFTAALTSGASYVAASRLMRLVAVAYVLLAILLFSLTFPFLGAMRAAFPGEAELLPVLALVSAVVTLVSFLAGTLLANRLFVRFGVATVALALPLAYLFGFGLWLVRFTTATAIAVRIAQQVTQRGISNAAWSTFYNVVPARRRGQVLAFMDGVPGQIGTMLSGVLLIIATSLALEQVFVLGLVTALLCLWVGVLIRRAYAASLVATLREGRAEQVLEGGPGLAALAGDARIVAELRAATRAGASRQRLLAADLLVRLGAHEAEADLRRLCSDDDPAVRRVAVTGVVTLSGPGARPCLEAALRDEDAGVRAAAIRSLTALEGGSLDTHTAETLRSDASPAVRAELAIYLAATGRTEEATGLLWSMLEADDALERAAGLGALERLPAARVTRDLGVHLDDASPVVRAAALRALAVRDAAPTRAVVAALDDPALQVRLGASAILRQRPDASDGLLDVLVHGHERSREPALLALEGHTADAGVRTRLLAWAEDQVARATALRGHAAALARADAASSAAFLGHVIERRAQAIEMGLLQALSALGAPEAGGLIRRCLQARDPEVRAQAIEALDSLGEPRLVRSVVRMLDGEMPHTAAASGDVSSAAAALVDDRDAWVRALALRTLSDHLRAEQLALASRVDGDADAIVRAAVRPTAEGAVMPERPQLVSDIERMLVLRRVPIFAALEPEDLQRVASGAVERSWDTDDVLMAEGALGDELVVVVEGAVRVVRGSGADEHVLRRVDEGDHIGELAVLREAPRAASVLAEPGGVRGLVISGDVVQALLRERPEAAMAMLATLADRISQQA